MAEGITTVFVGEEEGVFVWVHDEVGVGEVGRGVKLDVGVLVRVGGIIVGVSEGVGEDVLLAVGDVVFV